MVVKQIREILDIGVGVVVLVAFKLLCRAHPGGFRRQCHGFGGTGCPVIEKPLRVFSLPDQSLNIGLPLNIGFLALHQHNRDIFAGKVVWAFQNLGMSYLVLLNLPHFCFLPFGYFGPWP